MDAFGGHFQHKILEFMGIFFEQCKGFFKEAAVILQIVFFDFVHGVVELQGCSRGSSDAANEGDFFGLWGERAFLQLGLKYLLDVLQLFWGGENVFYELGIGIEGTPRQRCGVGDFAVAVKDQFGTAAAYVYQQSVMHFYTMKCAVVIQKGFFFPAEDLDMDATGGVDGLEDFFGVGDVAEGGCAEDPKFFQMDHLGGLLEFLKYADGGCNSAGLHFLFGRNVAGEPCGCFLVEHGGQNPVL